MTSSASSSARRVAPGLEALLDPGSVALVGASRRRSRWGFLFVRGMQQGAERRNNYYISRSVDEPSEGWYTSIEALPEVPELVVLLIGDEGSRQQVELCLELGSKAVITIATPFTGRDDPLLDRVAEAGLVVLGPNTMGLVCPPTQLDLAPPLLNGEPREPGRVAVVSQSGTVSADLALGALRPGGGAVDLPGHRRPVLPDRRRCDPGPGRRRLFGGGDRLPGGSPRRRRLPRRDCSIRRIGAPLWWSCRLATPGRRHGPWRPIPVRWRPTPGCCGPCARRREPGSRPHRSDAVDLACVAVRRRWAAGRRVGVLSEGGGMVALAADVLGRAGLVLPALGDRDP